MKPMHGMEARTPPLVEFPEITYTRRFVNRRGKPDKRYRLIRAKLRRSLVLDRKAGEA
jgi:hypothetical protein